MLRPESGEIIVDGVDVVEATARELNEVRTLFGMMFQDGALFGSMNLYDNTAFPLREHTRKKEREIRNIVMEKLEMVGLAGDEGKFPSEISGRHAQACRPGARFGAGATDHSLREPDSGLDPVQTAYLSQLLHHYL